MLKFRLLILTPPVLVFCILAIVLKSPELLIFSGLFTIAIALFEAVINSKLKVLIEGFEKYKYESFFCNYVEKNSSKFFSAIIIFIIKLNYPKNGSHKIKNKLLYAFSKVNYVYYLSHERDKRINYLKSLLNI